MKHRLPPGLFTQYHIFSCSLRYISSRQQRVVQSRSVAQAWSPVAWAAPGPGTAAAGWRGWPAWGHCQALPGGRAGPGRAGPPGAGGGGPSGRGLAPADCDVCSATTPSPENIGLIRAQMIKESQSSQTKVTKQKP